MTDPESAVGRAFCAGAGSRRAWVSHVAPSESGAAGGAAPSGVALVDRGTAKRAREPTPPRMPGQVGIGARQGARARLADATVRPQPYVLSGS